MVYWYTTVILTDGGGRTVLFKLLTANDNRYYHNRCYRRLRPALCSRRDPPFSKSKPAARLSAACIGRRAENEAGQKGWVSHEKNKNI